MASMRHPLLSRRANTMDLSQGILDAHLGSSKGRFPTKTERDAQLRAAGSSLTKRERVLYFWRAFRNNGQWKDQYLLLSAKAKNVSMITRYLHYKILEEKEGVIAKEIKRELEEGASPDEAPEDVVDILAVVEDPEEFCGCRAIPPDHELDDYEMELHDESIKDTRLREADRVLRKVDSILVQYSALLHMSGTNLVQFVEAYVHQREIISSEDEELTFTQVEKLMKFNLELETMLELCHNWVTANDQLQFKVALLCINSLPIIYYHIKHIINDDGLCDCAKVANHTFV